MIQLDTDNDAGASLDVDNGLGHQILNLDEAGNLWVDGDLMASGSKPAVVDTAQFGKRKLYAIESTGVWFEDFGSAQLKDGVAVVEIDTMFAETVNLEVDYQVFLTPVDGWAPLYVTNRTSTSFEVRDANGNANIAFDFRIVAKRLGYEDVRMEPFELTLENKDRGEGED